MFRPYRDEVEDRQLKVQELCIPFLITGNATPASKTLQTDAPAVLFLRTEDLDKITEAAGALESGESVSFDLTADDSDGNFNLLVRIDEPIQKIVSAQVVNRKSGVAALCYVNASGDSLSSLDDKIALNCDSAVDLSAANLDACLIVRYVVGQP